MRKIFYILILISVPVFSNQCIECHKNDLNYKDWAESAHFNVGVDCYTCHNGNPEENKKEKAHLNIKIRFSKKEIALLCGNCHKDKNTIARFNPNLPTDQLDSYKTSKHGISLFSKNDENVATCTDCHNYHKILKVDNPLSEVYPSKVVQTCSKCHSDKTLMKKYGISGDEVEEYKKSVHYDLISYKNELSAPTCDDCHGSHGAIPPGVSSIRFVCGNCHILNQEMFEGSPHKKPWEENNFKYCEECHSNHKVLKTSDELLNPEKGLCLNCHTKKDKGGTLMVYFYNELKKNEGLLEENGKNAKRAEQGGIFMEDTFINLQEARAKLVKARTLIHTFTKEKFDETLKEGFEVLLKEKKVIENAFKELSSRRKGLGLFSILAIILAILIYLKIKDMEKKKNG
ncbi:MAG: hypothetical protein WHV67_07150 [Thermoanaerobaculia bacterium]